MAIERDAPAKHTESAPLALSSRQEERSPKARSALKALCLVTVMLGTPWLSYYWATSFFASRAEPSPGHPAHVESIP